MAIGFTSIAGFFMRPAVQPLVLPNPLDWGKDFFFGALEAFAEMLEEAYVAALEMTVKLIIDYGVPPSAALQGDWFQFLIGGTYGLASKIVVVIALVMTVYVMLTPLRDHGQGIAKVLTSFVLIAVLGPLFFPVYGLLAELSRGLSEGLLELTDVKGGRNGVVEVLVQTLIPGNVAGAILTGLLGSIIMVIVAFEVFFLNLWLLAVLIGYPLAIAVRPFGALGNFTFHSFNSGILTLLLAPPLMTFFLSLSLLLIKLADRVSIFAHPMAKIALTLGGGILAMIAPVILAYMFYNMSQQVFGRMEASIKGAVDINSAPPLTTREARDSLNDTHHSGLRTFASGVAVRQLDSSDDTGLFDNIRDSAKTAAVASGHPEIAGVLSAHEWYENRKKDKHAKSEAEGGDEA